MKPSRLLIALVILLITMPVRAEKDSIVNDSGKLSARIYGDFKTSLNSNSNATAFEITRVYFGYSRAITRYLSGEVKLDIGSPEDESQYSLIRRYAYFKTAALTYERKKYTVWLGLFDMLQFKEQEKFWDRRYIYKSYMDEYKFGSSADIGAGVRYRIMETLSVDFVISNGEGYKMLQTDRYYKYGSGISWKPGPFIFRAYYDISGGTYPQMNTAVFAAFRSQRWSLGAEGIWQQNYKNYDGYQRYGYSGYLSYSIRPEWKLFGRYDQIYSNILPEQDLPWNLSQDGSAVIAGLEYIPIKNLRFSLNYQDWFPYAANVSNNAFLFLNVEFQF